MYLILSIVTGIYLILSSVRDLKERMIYSFPAIVLTLAWGTYSVELYENEYGFLLGAWIATVVLWFLFRRFSIWGEGDNDVFYYLPEYYFVRFGFVQCHFSYLQQAIFWR